MELRGKKQQHIDLISIIIVEQFELPKIRVLKSEVLICSVGFPLRSPLKDFH